MSSTEGIKIMKLETKTLNDLNVLTAKGDFTFHNLFGVLDTIIETVAGFSSAKVLVDLSQAKFIDASGIGAIVLISKKVRLRQGSFGVVVKDQGVKDEMLV